MAAFSYNLLSFQHLLAVLDDDALVAAIDLLALEVVVDGIGGVGCSNISNTRVAEVNN